MNHETQTQALHLLIEKIRPYLAVADETLVTGKGIDEMGAYFEFESPQPALRGGKRYVMLLVEIDDDEAFVPAEGQA